MRKFIARLNRAHKRAALGHELQSMRVWNSPLADERIATIARQIDEIDAQDRQDYVPRMPVLQRAVPAYPQPSSSFKSAATQTAGLVLVAAAVAGALWN